MAWPNDADGDALRRLEENGVNLALPHAIDFDIEFQNWPPDEDLVKRLQNLYGRVSIYPPEGGAFGFVSVKILAVPSYEFVVRTQEELSALSRSSGGVCESWGVLH